MNYVGAFFRNIGLFWAITIIGGVSAVAVVLALTFGGYLFVHNVAAPLSKNLGVQNANNQYQITQQSQAYQDTFVQQTDKAYQQLKADMWNTAQAASSGDKTM